MYSLGYDCGVWSTHNQTIYRRFILSLFCWGVVDDRCQRMCTLFGYVAGLNCGLCYLLRGHAPKLCKQCILWILDLLEVGV